MANTLHTETHNRPTTRGRVRWPNLFIIGAPKCGTTAMSRYLAEHPQVFMSEEAGMKEPNFFNSDHDIHWKRIRSVHDYLQLFTNAPPGVHYTGDASVLYLYSSEAVPRLLEKSPNARLVLMIRNPLEMVQSLFNQYVKSGGESARDLNAAWRRQCDRMEYRVPLPGDWRDPKLLQYGQIAKLGQQTLRLFKHANREQVHVIVYDDFVSDPRSCYLRLLRFLTIDDDGRNEFQVLNRRKSYRSPLIEYALRRLSLFRERIGVPGGWGVNALIDRMNVVDGGQSEPLTNNLRAELIAYFRDDVLLLSELMGRDFSHWLEV